MVGSTTTKQTNDPTDILNSFAVWLTAVVLRCSCE
jgi:hypothetical protein